MISLSLSVAVLCGRDVKHEQVTSPFLSLTCRRVCHMISCCCTCCHSARQPSTAPEGREGGKGGGQSGKFLSWSVELLAQPSSACCLHHTPHHTPVLTNQTLCCRLTTLVNCSSPSPLPPSNAPALRCVHTCRAWTPAHDTPVYKHKQGRGASRRRSNSS